MKKTIYIILILLITLDVLAQEPVDYVNLFIATADDHGQTDPAATVPYGMIKVSPDTDPKNHSGYNYENNILMGFSINRIGGVGCRGAGGNLRILPKIDKNPTILLNKKTEVATPGYYTVELSNGIRVELTATNNMAVERYYFGLNDTILLDLDSRSSFASLVNSEIKQSSTNSLTGYYQAKNVCDMGLYTQYYNLRSNLPFRFLPGNISTLEFVKSHLDYVEIRIVASGIDEKTAERELDLQSALTFTEIKDNARDLWNKKLNIIQVSGNDLDKTLFYTSLYRSFLSPVNVTSLDGTYKNSRGIVEKADGFNYMSSWSLWDTYRTKFPLLSLLDPSTYTDASKSLVQLYKTGKSAWATENETTPTVRTEHAMIILLDAYRKGIKGLDLRSILPQLEEEANNLPLKSPDNYLESSYDLWALANIYKELNLKEKFKFYNSKSDSLWRGKWIEKFKNINPETFDIMHGDGLYEGTLWQYRWAVPFNIDELAKLVGGKEKLAEQLEYFFTNSLYNHGNQPDIHAAFIFNRLNRPELSQKWVSKILKEPLIHPYGTHDKFKIPIIDFTYKPTPRGFIREMDDDDGTMSSWYVWASMGLYPLIVGEPYYEITLPIFDEISFRFDSGKVFIIKKKTDSKITKILLNKKQIKDFKLYHKDIIKGGLLEIY